MNEEKYTIITNTLHLIEELYNINITILSTQENFISFEKKFHFHNTQTAITHENISRITSNYKEEIVYLTDSFMINYIIFHIHNIPILFGPFCSILLTSNDVRTILNRYKIQDLSIKDFFSYYNSFPVLTQSQAIHIVETLKKNLGNETNVKLHKITHDYITTAEKEDLYNIKREHDIPLIEKRYANEQHFLLSIEKGNIRSALMDLKNMEADVKYLKRLGTTLESERIGAAITRTSVRFAAMRAKLPVVLIDSLSRKNTIATIHAKTVDEILQAKETMIREFCLAIQNCKNNQQNALVQSIFYYLEHNYYKDITLDTLSDELNISKNHIITSFRKETNMTPMAYLRKIRLQQASILLSGTNLSVQEISMSVGIPDSNYFIKLFKKEYGTTPYSYRKQLTFTKK